MLCGGGTEPDYLFPSKTQYNAWSEKEREWFRKNESYIKKSSIEQRAIISNILKDYTKEG